MKKTYFRGEIYLADLSPARGSEQDGLRPVIVIQNNKGNRFSPTLIVAAVTTGTKKRVSQPTQYLIMKNPALGNPSIVLTEQLRTIDKSRLVSFLGRVTEGQMRGIERALARSLALNIRTKTGKGERK